MYTYAYGREHNVERIVQGYCFTHGQVNEKIC